MSEVQKLLFHTMLLFFVTGSVAGMLAGTALILRPGWILYVGKFANRWISTRPITLFLERMIMVDRWFYRHHYLSGTFLLAGAIFVINFFLVRFDKAHAFAKLHHDFAIAPTAIDILLNSAVLVIISGVAFAFLISLFLLVRPSMLKGFEQESNQWISLRRGLKPLEVQCFELDEYLISNDKMAGVVLLCASLYSLVGLTIWL